MSGISRFNFLRVTDYAKRIKVNVGRLSQAQQDLLKEQNYKEREMAMAESERKLNETIVQLEDENQKEIEKMQQVYDEQYKKEAANIQQQRPVVITRIINRKRSFVV